MYAIGFLVGCWALLQCSVLPSLWMLLLIVVVCLSIAGWCRDLSVGLPCLGECRWAVLWIMLGCCFLGLFWQGWHAQGLLGKRLSVEQEGKELSVSGTISDIPSCDKEHCSFTLETMTPLRMRVRLSWYGVGQRLHVGERWQLVVRLKRPRGTLNPGAFDAEAWSWQHHLSAKGYVNNRGENRCLGLADGYLLARWRERLLEACKVLLVGERLGGVITALNLGWTQDIPAEQRVVVQRTGTAHLLAISGLHVGMVAGLVGWLLRWVWSWVPRVTEVMPAPTVAAYGAIVTALVYSEMAGFACSTQRACVMCALLLLPKIAHRHMTVKTALFRAVWLVLLWDPCVVQSSGFWLSFLAVFVLVYARYTPELSRWVQHLEAQWVCLIGLLPLSCWYFHQVSLVSVLANLIAIPVVGFVVLPLVLVGSAFVIKQSYCAKFFFLCAMKILACLGLWLSWLSQQHWAVWTYSFAHWWEFLIVTLGCAVVVFTQKKWRWVGLVGVLPLALPPLSSLEKGQFKLSVLDVGQGLASVIATRHHTLIYDTGAKFSSQLDCGQQIVIPYLIQEKIRVIDALVVSHGDNDHAGGAMAILQQIPVKKFYTSAIQRFSSLIPTPSECIAGVHWEWDDVKFEFLHPAADALFKSNDRSCVLKVSSQNGSVLFPGDIEKAAERGLCEHCPEQMASTIVIVPHHGSKTSSTHDFIAAVHPKVAIFTYGYRNRYRHPNAEVVERYLESGAKIFNTMSVGALSYTLGSTHPWQFYRQNHHEFWRVSE